MSKIWTVWGTPGAGKTTLALQLATVLSRTQTVLLLCPDEETPVLPYLFPKASGEELPSLGDLLQLPSFTEYELKKHLCVPERYPELGILGYAQGEQEGSYPAVDSAKLERFRHLINFLGNVIIVDIMHPLKDGISKEFWEHSDRQIFVMNADRKALSYWDSQGGDQLPASCVVLCNQTAREERQPVSELAVDIRRPVRLFPYCPDLRSGRRNGTPIRLTDSRPGRKALQKLLQEVSRDLE